MAKTLFAIVLFLTSFISLVQNRPAPPLTDIVFLRQQVKNGKLQLCVAHTGYGYVTIQPHYCERVLNYVQNVEFPNIQRDLHSVCFKIHHPEGSFKLIGSDATGQVAVGPWAFVRISNNRVTQWTVYNNKKYKNDSFLDQL